jgi:hypothetical protein
MSRSFTKVFSFLAAAALAAAVSARAGDSETVTVGRDATVGGASLVAGDYLVSWKAHRGEANVTFQSRQWGMVVTKAQGRIEKRGTLFEHDAVLFSEARNGSPKLIEIRLGGTNKAIVFTPPSAAPGRKMATGDRTARRIPEFVPGFGYILDYDWAPNPIGPSPNESQGAAPGKSPAKL